MHSHLLHSLRKGRLPALLRVGCGALLLGCLPLACSHSPQVRTLKLAHGLGLTHPVHQAIVFLAERVEEKSAGRMRIEVYPNQQLGSERQLLELLQIGSVDMTKVSGAVLENFSPRIRVFSLPYLFRDREHAYRVYDGPIGRELLLEGERYWLRGLTYFDAGWRSFYTKSRPVRRPEDLQGLKIRVQESPVAIALVRSLGAAPTPISWGELYTALQQGVVDGAENNPPSFHSSRHYEVCPYYALNEHTNVPDILLISTHTWNRLRPDERAWLEEAVREATAEQRRLWQQAETEALEAVKAAGVTILHPDKSPFVEKVQPLLEQYRQDPLIGPLIQRIQRE